jgi:glycosyltransferase involved in cell wall biosynthesis
MRLLHLFDLFAPTGGGTAGVMRQLTAAQVRQGHQVSIYTSDINFDPGFAAEGVRVTAFHCPGRPAGFYYTPDIRAAARHELGDFDMIHCHAVRSYQNLVVLNLARRRGVPYIIDSHGSLPRLLPGSSPLRAPLKWLYDLAWGRAMLRDAAGYVANNSIGENEYRSYGIEDARIRIIPHPFNIAEYTPLPPAGSFRARHQLGNRPLVLTMCRIHRIKGLDFLTDAFAALKAEFKDAALVIAGPDEGHRGALERQAAALGISDSLIFTGFLSGEDKLAALADADIFVQPSRYEHSAWSVFEAVLCGTPVIATRGSGSGEDVAHLAAGTLTEYGDVTALAEAISRVLRDPAPPRQQAAAAAARIRLEYTADQTALAYNDWYEECIAR